MPAIEEQLKAEAYRLGFQLSGITRPEPSQHLPVYRRWLERGRHAAMHYLATERALSARLNPLEILPECRSILVLGIRYPDPNTLVSPLTGEAVGRVAAYAWGDDYHTVIPARLRTLLDRITGSLEQPGVARIYTDTGPILERDLAQRAGLGWAGKNTCLIHPRQGSFFLLAEVFLAEELEPDVPFQPDLCGSCRRCIEACPTSCIGDDRTIDSNRCISYLTIENKGEIPVALRPQLGSWVFGCDVCQQVCPWNLRFSDPDTGFEFAPRDGVPQPRLRAELHLSPQEFNRKFKNSPVQRARRRGYLRNVSVALGNARDRAAIPDLADVVLYELEPLVRGHAAWALGEMDSPTAREKLAQALGRESDPAVRLEIERALAHS